MNMVSPINNLNRHLLLSFFHLNASILLHSEFVGRRVMACDETGSTRGEFRHHLARHKNDVML